VLWIKVNVADPVLRPVTIPALVTLATEGLLLTHVPPVDGERVVVVPTHILVGPVTETGVLAETVIMAEESD
jgi:hypothetical protein